MEGSQQPKMPRKVFNQREPQGARLAPVLCLGFRDQSRGQKSSTRAGQYLSLATEAASESDEGQPELLRGTTRCQLPMRRQGKEAGRENREALLSALCLVSGLRRQGPCTERPPGQGFPTGRELSLGDM